MNQREVIRHAGARVEKVLDQRVDLVLKRSGWRDVAHQASEAAVELPGHLFFELHRAGHAVERDLRIPGGVEVSALIPGRWRVAENLRPRRISTHLLRRR